jgi:hypothetical protein
MARRAEVRCEPKKKKGGALWCCAPLKAARGGGRGWRGGGNGGRERRAGTVCEAMGEGKAVAAAAPSHSVRPGHLCSDREADGWAPRGFDVSNLSKTGSTLKIQNGCQNLLKKFPIFACGSLGMLSTIFSIVRTSNSQNKWSKKS